MSLVKRTEDFAIEVKLRCECGEPNASIASAMGCSGRTIRQTLRAAGVPRRKTGPKVRDVATRFWAKVKRGAPNDCWPYMGYREKGSGYGHFGIAGEIFNANRVAFFLTHGYWPNVCRHTCDYRPCCNPTHLLDGTQEDNMRDMAERGRRVRGDGSPIAVLREKDVSVIKALLATHSDKQLAAQFGCSDSTIWNIRVGNSWRHIA